MLCFRIIFWSVVFVIVMIPGVFFVNIVGRLAGFRPGRKPGEVEKAFGWVGLVVLGGLMLGICTIAGLIDWGVSAAVNRMQEMAQHRPPHFDQPFPPNDPPFQFPEPIVKPPPEAKPKPIRLEWVDARMEKVYLADMLEFDVKVGWGNFGKKGKLGYDVVGNSDIKFQGQLCPNGISMHPPSRGHSTAKYRLDGQFKLFVSEFGLTDTEHAGWRPATPAVFYILGDGELLWFSIAIDQPGTKSSCRLSVEGVQILELQIHCNGHNSHVRGVWLDPQVLK